MVLYERFCNDGSVIPLNFGKGEKGRNACEAAHLKRRTNVSVESENLLSKFWAKVGKAHIPFVGAHGGKFME